MYKEGWGIQPRSLDGLGRQGGDALQVPGLEVDLDVNGGLLLEDGATEGRGEGQDDAAQRDLERSADSGISKMI